VHLDRPIDHVVQQLRTPDLNHADLNACHGAFVDSASSLEHGSQT
jgi:hypothetical protein